MSRIEDLPIRQKLTAALWQLVTIAAMIILYLIIAHHLSIHALWSGFLFLLYWGAIKAAAPAAFMPGMLGSLMGIGLAYMLHSLPLVIGRSAGLAVALTVIVVALYLEILKVVPSIFNLPMLLLLTVAAIPAVQHAGDFHGMAASILYAAFYFGLLTLTRSWIASRRNSVHRPDARTATARDGS